MEPDRMDYEKIGDFIAQRRKEKGLTQLQLAELLGVSDRAVSKWERAKSFPDVSLLKPLCQALNISISELLDGELHQESGLTKEEDGEAIVRGLQTYGALLKKKTNYFIYGFIGILVVIVMTLILTAPEAQPADLASGDFSVTGISVGSDHQSEGVGLTWEFDEETENQVKAVLSMAEHQKEDEKLSMTDPIVEIDEIGKFSENGYRDDYTNRKYTYDSSYEIFVRLYNIANARLDDLNYEEDSYTLPKLPKNRSLHVNDKVTERPQEKIIAYYANQLTEQDKEHPEAYIETIDILSLKRLHREEYQGLDCYGDIMKALIDKEIYEYRIYSCVSNVTYSEGMKALGPQNPEGKRKQYFLIGKSGTAEDGYCDAEDDYYRAEYGIYCVSNPDLLR